jgi:hypothetical protein
MVFRNWQGNVTIIVVLGSSMFGCVHRAGSDSHKSTVATGEVDKSTSLPKGPRTGENIDRSQEGIRVRSSPAPPPSMTRPDAGTQQRIDTAGTAAPSYSVAILTYQPPASDRRLPAPSVPPNNAAGFDRGPGRLRPRTATLIAVALIAAMVWLPRLRHRGQSTRRQGT